MKIVLASNNKHKIQEFKEIMKDFEILPMEEVGFYEDIVEDGQTFEENATIKAEAVFNFLKEKGIDGGVIADDSGLCVNALGGQPGIYSARYSGVHGDNKANRVKLLKNMEGKTDRTAYFVCCLVYIDKNGKKVVEGRTYGHILDHEEGEGNFGFDPVFYSDEIKKSFGVARPEEKNAVSHRGKAIKLMLEKLK